MPELASAGTPRTRGAVGGWAVGAGPGEQLARSVHVAAALANELLVVGALMSTARTRAVATRSAYGVRTLWPAEARNSGWAASAVRVAEMSVPEAV